MSDEFTSSKAVETNIEQDFEELKNINACLADYVKQRYVVTDRIKNKLNNLRERIAVSDDWFEGNVRGNPTEDRGAEEGPSETRSDYNQRRF